ncbi:TetR/AcrR family transcriptional regulator [Actinomadura kijaniata]|uniref:TetR/AcrR family transcriptional regulator n=1 Tax=Actinomadura kijaniata TaxID=46161 RepID=UPI003F1A5444
MPEATPRRTARSRDAILRAALDLCAEQGYATVTMEAIAARARVGKPTVYRWWPGKNAVLLDALQESWAESVVPLPDTGDIITDLRNWLHRFVDTLNDPRLRPIIVGLLGAAQHDPALKTAIRERFHVPFRAANQVRLVAAQETGRLPRVAPELLEDSLVAPLWYRLLVSDEPFGHADADAVLANALHRNCGGALPQERAEGEG